MSDQRKLHKGDDVGSDLQNYVGISLAIATWYLMVQKCQKVGFWIIL